MAAAVAASKIVKEEEWEGEEGHSEIGTATKGSVAAAAATAAHRCQSTKILPLLEKSNNFLTLRDRGASCRAGSEDEISFF